MRYQNQSGRTIRVRNSITGKTISVGPGATVHGEGWEEAARNGVLVHAGGPFRSPRIRVGTTSDKIAIPDQDAESKKHVVHSQGKPTQLQDSATAVVVKKQPEPVKAPAPAPTSTQSEQALPAGWIELIEEKSGKPYYYNKALNKTQWARPIPEPVPTPADLQPAEEPQGPDGFDPAMSPATREEYIRKLGTKKGDDAPEAIQELYLIRDYLTEYEPKTPHINLINEQLTILGADIHS